MGAELIGLSAKLRTCGAHLHLDIPAIVVCGDQSAGKSSLIQRICGVNMPRSDGTCTRSGRGQQYGAANTLFNCRPAATLCVVFPPPSTHAHRCPMEVRIHTGPAWSCTIKLRLEFNSAGEKLRSVDEYQFGSVLAEKDQVELQIRRVQKEVLNPAQPHNTYVDYPSSTVTKLRKLAPTSSHSRATSWSLRSWASLCLSRSLTSLGSSGRLRVRRSGGMCS